MRSSFFEFNVATTALFTARGGLDTTLHNVSNASTKGYTRQVVEQRATTPLMLNDGRGMIGTGVEIFGINQMRNVYLDKKYWSEMGVLGEYNTKSTYLSLTERLFNEVSDTGLSAQFDGFFDQTKDLATNVPDSTFRINVAQLGNSITTFVKNTYEALKKQQRDLNSEVKAMITVINSLGQQIRSLNEQIVKYEVDGSRANDLRDERNNLVDELSRYVNLEVNEVERDEDYAAGKYPDPGDRGKSRKEFSVMINGHDFVKGSEIDLLVCRERMVSGGNINSGIANLYYNPEDNAGLYDIYWVTSNNKFDIYNPYLAGELRGLIEVRDGNNDNYAKNAQLVSYDFNTGDLILNMAGNRFDLNPGGGRISVYDSDTGRTTDYEYLSYDYDFTSDQAAIVIADPKSTDLFTKAGAIISIGRTSSFKGVPYYMSRLNDLVRTFSTAVNEGVYLNRNYLALNPDKMPGVVGHVNGYNLDGDNLKTLFYTYLDDNGDEARYNMGYNVYKMTSENFILNSDLVREPSLMAASTVPEAGQSDNRLILGFSNIKEDVSLFQEGSLKDYIVGMSAELGIDVKQADNYTKNYTDITNTIDNQRMSFSGVDINEEMISMIKYQQQYQAAAKLINIIDTIYDLTINRLGV